MISIKCLGCRYTVPPSVDRIWNCSISWQNPHIPIFYQLQGDYRVLGLRSEDLRSEV